MDVKEIVNLKTAALQTFAKHPFKPYGEGRLNELAESIKANGVMMPIIVRPLDEGRFEILSGHNRVKAAEKVGFEEIPAIVREGLNDDEAMLIVTETNLIQRSFADMSYSEKAAVLTARHDAMVSQGKRTDLINDVQNILKPSDGAGSATFSHDGEKLRTHENLSEDFGISVRSIVRYIRINTLIPALKTRLDDNEIAIVAAVSLSYLDETAQHVVNRAIEGGAYKITPENAEKLRERSANTVLTPATVEEILKGEAPPAKPVREKRNFGAISSVVSKHFKGGENTKDIKRIIDVALSYYLKNKETVEAAENAKKGEPD